MKIKLFEPYRNIFSAGLSAGLLFLNFIVTGPSYAEELVPLLDAPTDAVIPTVPTEETSQSTEIVPTVASEWTMWSSPLSIATATGRSLYVSKTGSNSGDGSQTNPWATIQYGVSQLQAGDTLNIMDGVYEENVTLVSSGLSNATITIQGVGNVVIDGSNLSTSTPGFNTNGNSYIRFNNLTVNHMLAGIEITPGSSFVEIDGFNADGDKYAVRINGGSNVTVRNAYAVNSNNAFRAFGGSHDLLFENIKTYSSQDIFPGMDPNYLNGDGFIFESDVSNATLRNIVSANNWDAGFDIKASNVLIENAEAFGNKNNFKVWGNNITIKSSLSHHGKRQLRSDGTTVEGNGITVESGTTKVMNTTFVDNEDHDIRIYVGGSLTVQSSIVARRNISGLLYENNGSFKSQDVLWYNQAMSGPNFKLSLTDFWTDPLFVNWVGGNYRLKETSLAVNYTRYNTSLSQYDLDLNPRFVGPKPDLGAYEYQSVPTPKFKGISNGDAVKGTIFVEPNRTTFPTLLSVSYFVDGQQSYTAKTSPFTWGGSKGFNTKTLTDGTHILTGVFQTNKKVKQEYSLAFTVANNTTVVSVQDVLSTTPQPTPQAILSFPFKGLDEGGAVSGTIFVQPDLQALPPINKVIYYLEGGGPYTAKKAPFTWGGREGFDTTNLTDGISTLRVVVQTPDGNQEFSVLLSVLNDLIS